MTATMPSSFSTTGTNNTEFPQSTCSLDGVTSSLDNTMKIVADKVYTKRQAGIYRIGYQWEIGDDGLFTVKLTQTSNRFIEDVIKTRWDNTHRDVARSKAYKAERSSWIWKGEAGLQLTIKQANAFLQSVLKTQWFQRRYSSLFCGKNLDTLTVIYPEYYRRTATGGRAQLFLPEWARTQTIILHELAHLLKARALPYSSKEGKSYAGHGRAWAWIFADLVHRKIGKLEGDDLRQCFRNRKCPFNKRRKGNNFNPFTKALKLKLNAA